jgi:Zn-dependent alcohol dehydrogenase
MNDGATTGSHDTRCSAIIFGLGGVGLSAMMGALVAGCDPIVAVDRLKRTFDLARQLGATPTLQAGQTDTLVQDTGDHWRRHHARDWTGTSQAIRPYSGDRPSLKSRKPSS